MKTVLDQNLSWRIARALAVLVEEEGHRVLHLRDKFDTGSVADATWITALGREGGWTVISGDVRITRNPYEREAWRRSRLKGFFLAPGWSKLKQLDRAARLIMWWPKIVSQADLVEPGAAFEMPINPNSRFRALKP